MDSIDEYLTRYVKMHKPRLKRFKSSMRKNKESCLTPIPQSFLQKIAKEKSSENVTEKIFTEENKKFYSSVISSRSGSPFKTPPPSFYPNDKIEDLGYFRAKATDSLGRVFMRNKKLGLPKIRDQSEKSVKIEQILKDCQEARKQVIESSNRLKFFVDQDSEVMKMYAKKVARTSDVLMHVCGQRDEILKILFEEYKKSDEFHEREKIDLLKKLQLKKADEYKEKARNMKKIMMSCRQKLNVNN